MLRNTEDVLLCREPKMQAVKNLVDSLELWKEVAYFNVSCDDNLCSSVCIRGSLQHKTEWANKIFHNSPYFIIHISAAKNRRYYDAEIEENCTIVLLAKHSSLPKMRKFTGKPEKCIAKLQNYVTMISETVTINNK